MKQPVLLAFLVVVSIGSSTAHATSHSVGGSGVGYSGSGSIRAGSPLASEAATFLLLATGSAAILAAALHSRPPAQPDK